MPDNGSDGHMQRQMRGVSLFRHGQAADRRPVMLERSNQIVPSVTILPASLFNRGKVWESLSPVTLDADHLIGNGLFPFASADPAATAFDMLRTRLLQGLSEKGWRRIGVTSPTHGCGKSFVASNLALSLARRPDSRTVLIDLDLRRPQLANLLGLRDTGSLQDYLSGEQPLESHFCRVGRNLALGMNGNSVQDSSGLLHNPETGHALQAVTDHLDPQVALFDLPPALVNDDVLALAPHLDAVLLVTDAKRSSPEEIRACERQFIGRIPLLGAVLNRASDRRIGRYRYGKD